LLRRCGDEGFGGELGRREAAALAGFGFAGFRQQKSAV
jgi:hypothetical protein